MKLIYKGKFTSEADLPVREHTAGYVPFREAEDMSKTRFVCLSLLPNLVFGWIPFVLFLLQPQWLVPGAMGALSIPMGVGDYYNVFNCLTQVPKGGLVYMSGMHSYWYLP